MLDISVKIEGDRVFIAGLNKLAQELPQAIDSGLVRSAVAIHRGAYAWLKGPGAKGTTSGTAVKEGGRWKIKNQKWTKQSISAGSYPVPVRTGHLRRSLNWLKPGESKSGDVGTFSAGHHEVVIYNSAFYANAIHEGKNSSAKYGPRRYLTDAFEMFNRGRGIQRAIENEIKKAKGQSGLK